MRRISIFGITGSVGESTFDLIRRAGGAAAYSTVAVTGGRNIRRLAEMAKELNAEVAVTAYDECFADLRQALAGTSIQVASGANAVVEAAQRPVDWVMSGIVGAAGLPPGLAALRQGATLALANKESLVTAGPLLMATAKSHGATVLPVDSEHSAIFQALIGEDMARVEKITLTASGGALRDWPVERLAQARVEEALNHPNWAMGPRITIDSASMFNKALEVIETREFFDVSPDQVDVIIHPESIIHSMVSFVDGGVIAHLGAPDMRHPIGFALNWPERLPLPVERLDLARLGKLSFHAPDLQRYPALGLARQVMQVRGLSGAVFTAAKEIALDLFIAGKIGFMQMADLVEATLDRMMSKARLGTAQICLDDILKIDAMTRQIAGEIGQSMHESRS